MNNKITVDDFPKSKRSILRMILLGFLIMFLYKVVVVDLMGFCYKRFRFVSSEELILNHIEGLMKTGRMRLDAADSSPKAYLIHHPNCCKVVGLLRNSFLFTSAEVSVTYEMSDIEKKRRGVSLKDPENHYQFIAFDTACGETRGHMGITTTAPVAQTSAFNQ